MKIYTKTGDSGITSLIGGDRVAKNHPRVEAYGDVDELLSAIGVLKAHLVGSPLADPLLPIQEYLITLSAHLANGGNQKILPPLKQEFVADLERQIDQMQECLPPLNSFMIPGPPVAAAYCHIARTVCRRAERSVVALGRDAVAPEIITYLNRLSDFLFLLSRYITLQ